MIKSKKLSSLVAASLILAGGSFLGVQTVSADDSTRLAAVEALASQNSGFISELTKKVDNISTTPGQLQQIDTNKADIATNKGNIAANKTDIAANQKAIDKNTTDIAKEAAARVTAVQKESTDRDEADKAEAQARDAADQKLQGNIDAEAKARTDADTKLDTRITNVKEYLENQTAGNYVSKSDAAVQDGAVVKADKTIGENVTNLDGALAKETAARIGADKAQDKVIQTVNDNLVKSVNTINKNVADGFKALNATDQKLQGNIDAEAKARTDADTKLDTRITNVKEYLENQTAGNYVSKSDAAVQDGAVVKADKTIGENVTNLDGALAKETAARIGADKAQDKVIQTVNDNLVKSVNTINKNVADGFKALNATDQKLQGNIDAEAKARADKDKEHDTDIATNKDNIAKIQKDLAASNLKDMSETAANLKNYDTQMSTVQALAAGNQKNIATNKDNIAANKTAIADEATARDKADQKEASERKAEDSQLNTKMTNGFAAIQGQQDVQDAKIDKNHTDIQTNAGKIQNNQDAIKANSDKLTNHEDRITTNESNIERNAESIKKETNARIDADQQEAQTRAAEDTRLDTKMDKGFATIQGQQDEQDAKIGKNQKDIQTNAGKIQNNQDAIKANSDKIADHEDRISSNAKNIEANANTLHKVQGDVVDNKNAISAEAAARGDKDKEHDTAIAANKKAIGDEAAARQADISRLDNKIHDVSKEVDTVGALSMAMSGLHPLSYDEGDARFQLSAAVGTYDGTEALALGGFYHFNRDSMLSVGVATDLGADEHRMGANVGYTRRIGQGGHVSRPSEGTVSDIMKDIKNLEQKQAKLEQENEQLKQQLAALNK